MIRAAIQAFFMNRSGVCHLAQTVNCGVKGRCLAGILWLAASSLLAGCGSQDAAAFAVRCAIHRLPSGLFRVNVAVKNTTGSAQSIVFYGPPLNQMRHIYPVLDPAYVTVTVAGHVRRFVGFRLPRVPSNRSVHVLVRLAPPLHGQSIVATSQQTVHAASWQVLHNSDCMV
jgi:hypothetical protein